MAVKLIAGLFKRAYRGKKSVISKCQVPQRHKDELRFQQNCVCILACFRADMGIDLTGCYHRSLSSGNFDYRMVSIQNNQTALR